MAYKFILFLLIPADYAEVDYNLTTFRGGVKSTSLYTNGIVFIKIFTHAALGKLGLNFIEDDR